MTHLLALPPGNLSLLLFFSLSLFLFSRFSVPSVLHPSLHHLLPFTPAWRLALEVFVAALLVLLRSSVRPPPQQQLSLPSPHLPSFIPPFISFPFWIWVVVFFFFIFEEDRTPRSSSWPSVFWLSGAHLQKALFTCLHWLLMSAFPIILYALHWLISLQILNAWLLCPPVLHSY